MKDFYRDFLPNSFAEMGKTYFVSQAGGASDANPGTKEKPFRTINKAASVLGRGDKIIIGEGIYREKIHIPVNGHEYNPRSFPRFQAAPGEKVYIRGSEIFSPEWKQVSSCVFEAELPEFLFRNGTYNPFSLGIYVDCRENARPAGEEPLPETLGQVYIDSVPVKQVRAIAELESKENSFLVSTCGKKIMLHPPAGTGLNDCEIEINVREKCFESNFDKPLYMNVSGIRVEHAAEPGPFCIAPPRSKRKNADAGIEVVKEFSIPGASEKHCVTLESVNFFPDGEIMLGTVVDDTEPGYEINSFRAVSRDKGLNWECTGESEKNRYYYFTDYENQRMIRYFWRGRVTIEAVCLEPDGLFDLVYQISADDGQTWSDEIFFGRCRNFGYHMDMVKLNDGSILWQSQENQWEEGMHLAVKTWIGKWNADLTAIDWDYRGKLEIEPDKSAAGLSEPRTCQTFEGRLVMLLRQGAKLPEQDKPGIPSVKLISVSDDLGKTWTEPRPLLYDDGKMVYSPRSYQDIFRARSGAVYGLMNIVGYPTHGCDPRNVVNIGEIDPVTLCLKRNTVGIVDKAMPDHAVKVRLSNWKRIEDPATGDQLLFMKLHMCQFCQVREGYDFNTYRYRIILP